MGEALEKYLGGLDESAKTTADCTENSASRPAGLSIITGKGLLEMKYTPLRAPVDGLIVEGLTLLCGASKLGKSWLVLQMCCAVSQGRPFLGRRTVQGDVLYLALEDSERRLQSRLRTLGEMPDEHLHIAINAPTVESGLVMQLEGWVSSTENPVLIVVDTLQKVRDSIPGRTNAYAADYALIGALKAFADAHHIALVLVHHLNKMKDVEDKFDKISGSTGLMGAADSAILLTRERGSDDGALSFEGRDIGGDDITMRRVNGRWEAIGHEVQERESYERNPVVRACRCALAASFGSECLVEPQAFFDSCAALGSSIGTKKAMAAELERLAPKLMEYDGIAYSRKRAGSVNCICLRKNVGVF